LRARNADLKEFKKLMVDRELRMIEPKKEINAMLAKEVLPEKYEVGDETNE
jgi:hypothetical protein